MVRPSIRLNSPALRFTSDQARGETGRFPFLLGINIVLPPPQGGKVLISIKKNKKAMPDFRSHPWLPPRRL